MRLFTRALELLFPPRETELLVRTLGSEGLLSRLSPRMFQLAGTQATGLLPYRDKVVRAFILEAKFHGNKAAQEALGAVLAHHLRNEELVVLLPIPLGEKRRKERGYNQVEQICSFALSETIKLMPNVLSRTRDTLPQTELSGDARRKNVQNAFRATGDIDPSYTYIVVDDVATTGATLLAATAALRTSGAPNVYAIAIAH